MLTKLEIQTLIENCESMLDCCRTQSDRQIYLTMIDKLTKMYQSAK